MFSVNMYNYTFSVPFERLKLETSHKNPSGSMRSYHPFDYIRRVLPSIAPDKTGLPPVITFSPLTSERKLAFLILRGEKLFA